MCGIIAHVAFSKHSQISQSHLENLNNLQSHRGPDDQGIYCKDEVALAMCRLSIIDIEGGHQPMISHDKRYIIVFNGEIYNHDELRKILIQKGYPIKTRSDTETLLYTYIDKGPEALASLNGMFAFCIWDQQEKELFIARDRMGIKPLYYAINNDRIMFSSELTPIQVSQFFPMEFNRQAIADYLAYWYICEPQTIFKNVRQLPPGNYAVVKNKELKLKPYWRIPCESEKNIPLQQAQEELTDLLEDAIKLRMKVDVPIGTFLSGGIDSGLITTMAAKHIRERLKSFSIGFKEKTYSELSEAAKTAKHFSVDLYSSLLNEIKPDSLETIFQSLDEPLGNASIVPTYFLAKTASRHVKVVLTGDGGDELFGGYPTYQAPYYQAAYQRTPVFLRSWARQLIPKIPVSHNRISLDYRLKQLMKGIEFPYPRAHYTWREVTPLSVQSRLFNSDVWQNLNSYDPFSVVENYFNEAKRLSIKNQLMYVDLNTYLLNDHLRKIDRMAMAHSLETRVPFLDHRIVEFAMKLPSEYKVTFTKTKKILKEISKVYLPRSIINGKKKGLTSPIAGWITHNLKDYINDELNTGVIEELFNTKSVKSILNEHYQKKKDNSRTIWSLLTLKGWSKKIKGAAVTTPMR